MGQLHQTSYGKQLQLGAELLIGRSSACGLRLPEASVSAVHAQIRWSGRSWELRDLASSNGTSVDGRRVRPGEGVLLQKGMQLRFGGGAPWELADDSPPGVRAVCVDTGRALSAVDGLIALPSADAPQACICDRGDDWVLERSDSAQVLHDGETFSVGSQALRFECPPLLSPTPISHRKPCTLQRSVLRFVVSSDEEHVALAVECEDGMRDLGARSCFYLGLLLARERQRDADEGLSEQGWLDVEAVLKMNPEYQSPMHLNVDVHRLRRHLASADIVDASKIVERRTGQLRFGASRFRFEGMR